MFRVMHKTEKGVHGNPIVRRVYAVDKGPVHTYFLFHIKGAPIDWIWDNASNYVPFQNK